MWQLKFFKAVWWNLFPKHELCVKKFTFTFFHCQIIFSYFKFRNKYCLGLTEYGSNVPDIDEHNRQKIRDHLIPHNNISRLSTKWFQGEASLTARKTVTLLWRILVAESYKKTGLQIGHQGHVI